MKHKGLACLAAVAISALAAFPFTGRAQDSATLFDKTTSRLEQGGISYSYTSGVATYKMVNLMFDSIDSVVQDKPQFKEILDIVRTSFDELGFEAILGSGTSIKKTGDYYRCIDFEYAPKSGRKGLIWDMLGASATSKGAAPELKLTSPKSAIAVSFCLEPGAVYTYVEKKLRDLLPEEIMEEIDEQISVLNDNGIQPDKLLKSISGVTFYADPVEEDGKLAKLVDEFSEGEIDEDELPERIMAALPKFAFILTTKNDLCWKALNNFVSQADPDMVEDDRIVPVKGLAIFQAGNYLVVTNEESALRKRIDGKGTDLNSNAEFAKMLKLVDKDFSNFAWVSESYFTSCVNIVKLIQRGTGDEEDFSPEQFMLSQDFESALGTIQFNADGILSTSITSNLQIALLDSKTVPGVIAGFLPYLGPVVKALLMVADDEGLDFGIGEDDSMDAAILNARKIVADAALERLKGSKVPAGAVFFTLGDESLVFVKWNEDEEEFERVPEDTDEEEFPFVYVTSPSAAAKADNSDEIVVFFEDPMDNTDGIHFVFGDESVKFLEGDFDSYTEAAEAAVNSFDISESAAKKLLKRAAAIDEMFE